MFRAAVLMVAVLALASPALGQMREEVTLGRVVQAQAPICVTREAAEILATAAVKDLVEEALAEVDECIVASVQMAPQRVLSRRQKADGSTVLVLEIEVYTPKGTLKAYAITNLPIKGELEA